MNILKHLRFGILFAILIANFVNFASSSIASVSRMSQSEVDNVGTPLFLSPLIQSGQIKQARERAKVEHPEMFNLTSYAGYLTVNENYNSNLFFWYFPAKVDPENAPVILYLEGGPGASGLFGLFIHNGPYIVSRNLTVSLRKYPWTDKHNVIYVDSPVGTGWSFTKNEAGYARQQDQVGREMRIALVQFFKMFPSLCQNDFYIIGESYAGKFVPAVSMEIHKFNPTTTTDKINLKGLAIANGWTDPINQINYGDFLYQIGLIDANILNKFHALEEKARDLMRQDKHDEAYDAISGLVDGPAEPPTLFRTYTGFKWNFNILQTVDPIDVESAYAWIKRNDVRRALHVGNVMFNMWGQNVAAYMKNDGTRSQAFNVAELLRHYPVLIYTGQLDIVCGYSNVRNYLEKLLWYGAEEYKTAPRKQWMVGQDLAGYVKAVGNLQDVLLRNAGHVAGIDKPEWVIDLIEKFTRNQTLA